MSLTSADHAIARRLAVLALTASVALGGLAGCGSDDGGDEGSATTTTEPTADDATTTSETDEPATTTTTAEEGEGEGGGDLVGSWVADASEILASNTANLGGTEGLDCSGPVTLTFVDDGSFTQRSEATCGTGAMSATATIDNTGRYSASGGVLTIESIESNGSIEIMGRSQDASFGGIDEGEGAYTVDGDTLTITFENPSVGEVSQTYTRS